MFSTHFGQALKAEQEKRASIKRDATLDYQVGVRAEANSLYSLPKNVSITVRRGNGEATERNDLLASTADSDRFTAALGSSVAETIF